MAALVFKKAVRENEYTLTAIAGPTGSGKTFSALEFATGLVEGSKRRIAGIDTENGRMLHYATKFDFDHAELRPPYTPEAYIEAIMSAEEAGYGAIVVDSMSHEYAGEGGIDDIAQEALVRMCTDQDGNFNSAKAERMTALAWKDAKRRHKKMMVRLLQRKCHIIFCLRAEPKIKFEKEKVPGKTYEKTTIVDMGYQPICEKQFMFEMTLSMMMGAAAPGIPTFLKLEDQFSTGFTSDRHITRDSGAFMAKWASGDEAPTAKEKKPAPAKAEETPGKYSLYDANGVVRTTDDIGKWKKGATALFEKCPEKQFDTLVTANADYIKAVKDEGLALAASAVETAIRARQQAIAMG